MSPTHERQDVVAVYAAPAGRLVDLDQCGRKPKSTRSAKASHSRLSNGERRTEPAGSVESTGARREQHRRPVVVDGLPAKVLLCHERVGVGPHGRYPAAQAPVLDDSGVGERAAGRDGPEHERPHDVVLAPAAALRAPRRGSALGQVVHPLEPVPRGDDEPARRPQRLEHPLGGLRLHMPPAERGPSKWRDPRGPRSRISPITRSASAGSRSMTSPHHGWSGRESIRLRATGQSSIGSRHASCAQYSKTRPFARSSETVRGG